MKELARIALPTRIQGALDRMPDKSWRLWLHTPDFVHGTQLILYPDGKIERVTIRADEGDEIVLIKESDSEG